MYLIHKSVSEATTSTRNGKDVKTNESFPLVLSMLVVKVTASLISSTACHGRSDHPGKDPTIFRSRESMPSLARVRRYKRKRKQHSANCKTQLHDAVLAECSFL